MNPGNLERPNVIRASSARGVRKAGLLERMRDVLRTGREYHEDPEDIHNAMHFLDALGLVVGRGDATMVRRIQESEVGRALLRTRQPVLGIAADRKRLRELPEGSFGRCYLEFLEERGLDPVELAEIAHQARAASGGFVPNASCADVEYVHERVRDIHDLTHIATGYDSDFGSEFGLIAFMAQQNHQFEIMVSVLISMTIEAFKGRPDLFKTFYNGWKRGRDAEYLLAVDWDALLHLPLNEVRTRLRVGALSVHRPFSYTSEPIT